jgi:hypothetical protein
VLVLNPQGWPNDIIAYLNTFSPWVEAIPIVGPRDELGAMIQAVLDGDEPEEPPEPPPEPPEEPPTGRQVISLHVQQPVAFEGYGDLEFVRDVQPSAVKLVDYFEQAQRYKAASPDTLVFVRHFVNHQGEYYENPDPWAGARAFLHTFLDSLQANAAWIDGVEGLNEIGIACGNPDGIARTVEWECAFAEVLHEEMGDAVAPSLLAVPVGNPEHAPAGEIELMLPAVMTVVQYDGWIDYHGYQRAVNGVVNWEDDWFHYAGRALESWDPIFSGYGLYPRYILGESGAFFDAVAGWRHDNCLDGDVNALIIFLRELRRRIWAWNAEHGDRCDGALLFTLLGGDSWRYYNLHGYVRQLADALIAANS